MHYTVSDIKIMADNIAESKFFRYGKEKRPMNSHQIMTLMLIANSEGKHPARGPREHDIIDGKPTKKTEIMLADFQAAGGSVEWHGLDDKGGSATFSHPKGGSLTVDWDIERAKKAGLLSKDMWQKWRRNMFRSRIISEGVRGVFPAATSGLYNTEEMQDMHDSLAVIESPIEPLDDACARLALDVAASDDLNATYEAHIETFERMAIEQPDYIEAMNGLFEARAAELEKSEPKKEEIPH